MFQRQFTPEKKPFLLQGGYLGEGDEERRISEVEPETTSLEETAKDNSTREETTAAATTTTTAASEEEEEEEGETTTATAENITTTTTTTESTVAPKGLDPRNLKYSYFYKQEVHFEGTVNF